MVHDRVGDHGDVENILDRDPGRPGGAAGKLIEGVAHDLGHGHVTALVHHHVGHAAHQVFAEADLRIHHIGGGDNLAGTHVAKLSGDRGRAEIDGETIDFLLDPGPYGNDFLELVNRDRDLAPGTGECRL